MKQGSKWTPIIDEWVDGPDGKPILPMRGSVGSVERMAQIFASLLHRARFDFGIRDAVVSTKGRDVKVTLAEKEIFFVSRGSGEEPNFKMVVAPVGLFS